jgi:hypothetical protein
VRIDADDSIGEALIQAREVMNFNRPSNRAFSTLKRYFYPEKDKSVLIGRDANLLEEPEDLVALVKSNDDRLSQILRHVFGRCFSACPNPLFKFTLGPGGSI